jgi:hypothetical protein
VPPLLPMHTAHHWSWRHARTRLSGSHPPPPTRFHENGTQSRNALGCGFACARDVRDNFAEFDSFLVLHGTDTMAFTASALSFMFKNLSKTVIITGSQISMAFPVCDACLRVRARPGAACSRGLVHPCA